MKNKDLQVIAVVGPTGVGKSAAALEFARLIDAEIVSADSMQIYRGMDIGTDKPPPPVLTLIPHHLIDVANIKENFSVAIYQQLARKAIGEISANGRMPLVVGGSGLYVRAALDPLEFPTGKLLSTYRRRLEETAKKDSDALWRQLNKIDPQAAAKISPKNTRRIIRALEVVETSGELFSQKSQDWRERRSIYDTFFVGLRMDRDRLYEKIEERVEMMMRRGLLTETRNLVEKGLLESITAKQALGYKELIDFLDDKLTLDKAVALIKQRSRQYAKRQLTWFRADPRIHWLPVDDLNSNQTAEAIKSLVTKEKFM